MPFSVLRLPFSTLRRLSQWLAGLTAVLLLAGCMYQAASTSGSATSPLQSQSWWIGPLGGNGLSTIRAAQWQLFKGLKTFGYGPEPVWVRLQLAAAASPVAGPWVVQVRPVFLDNVVLYDPTAGLELQSGDFIGLKDDALGSVGFSFQIPAMTQEREVFLRLDSSSARAVLVDIQALKQAQQSARTQEWFLGFILSVAAVMTLWALLQCWPRREPVMRAFAAKQLLTTLWAFFYLGFARVLLGDSAPIGLLSAIASCILPWVIGATAWFLASLIREYEPPAWSMVLLRGFAVVCGLLPLLQLLGQTGLSLMLANALLPLGVVFSILALALAGKDGTQPPVPRRFLLTYLVINGLFNSISPAMFLGWIPESALALITNLFHVVTDSVVMWCLLQVRAGALEKRQQDTALTLLRVEAQATAEKGQREDMTQLFTMLAHEMKTPLAVLRMSMEVGALNKETLGRSISNMNQVLDRCVQTGQLADGGLAPVVQAVDAVELTLAVIRASRSPHRIDHPQLSVDAQAMHAFCTDPQMLSIVLGNLLDNACKYSEPQSRIVLTLALGCEAGRAGWHWEVENVTGHAGLPDEASLFRKYYRAPQARRQSGSGLGLFLVRGLLDLMQGHVHFEARGNRAVFKLWVPSMDESR